MSCLCNSYEVLTTLYTQLEILKLLGMCEKLICLSRGPPTPVRLQRQQKQSFNPYSYKSGAWTHRRIRVEKPCAFSLSLQESLPSSPMAWVWGSQSIPSNLSQPLPVIPLPTFSLFAPSSLYIPFCSYFMAFWLPRTVSQENLFSNYLLPWNLISGVSLFTACMSLSASWPR